jgi:hypothetical protein
MASYGPGTAGSSAVSVRLIARFQRKYQAFRDQPLCCEIPREAVPSEHAAACSNGRGVPGIEGRPCDHRSPPRRRLEAYPYCHPRPTAAHYLRRSACGQRSAFGTIAPRPVNTPSVRSGRLRFRLRCGFAVAGFPLGRHQLRQLALLRKIRMHAQLFEITFE